MTVQTVESLFNKELKKDLVQELSLLNEDWKKIVKEYERELNGNLSFKEFVENPLDADMTRMELTVKFTVTYPNGEQEELHIQFNEKTLESSVYTVGTTEKVIHPILNYIDPDWAKSICHTMY